VHQREGLRATEAVIPSSDGVGSSEGKNDRMELLAKRNAYGLLKNALIAYGFYLREEINGKVIVKNKKVGDKSTTVYSYMRSTEVGNYR
jgi:hypothetical protein